MHCHFLIIPTYRRVVLRAMGKEVTIEILGASFQPEAVLQGFRELSRMNYEDVLSLRR